MPRRVGSVLLCVDGRHFQVDRHLLASQSIYFRTLFRTAAKRDKFGAIIIPGNADRFGLILDYLTGEYALTSGQVKSIIHDGSSLYLISSLMYLAQLKTQYEANEKQRIEDVKRAMNKIGRLKSEIANLEGHIDGMEPHPSDYRPKRNAMNYRT